MKKIVIKLGGSALQDPDTLKELTGLVLGLRRQMFGVVIIHGGGPAINQALTAQGIEWRFIDGQRRTTPRMMKVIEDVLAGQVNAMVTTHLREMDIPVHAFSGAKDKILRCKKRSAELIQVGDVIGVDVRAIEACLAADGAPIPVIAPVGYGAGEERYNINADWAATKIAAALGATKLIFLTDQNGILDHEKKLILKADVQVMENLIATGVISGGMGTKVKAMIDALATGIQEVRVLNSKNASMLLTDANLGTKLATKPKYTRKETTYGRAS